MSTNEPRAERNKRVAIEAIQLLDRAATEEGLRVQEWLRHELAAFRERWAARGVPWVNPPSASAFDFDQWVTAEEMAEHADVRPGTVRMWHHRGHITSMIRDGRTLYNIGEVVKYQNRRQQTA